MSSLIENGWENIKKHYIGWWNKKGIVLRIDIKGGILNNYQNYLSGSEYLKKYHTDNVFCIEQIEDTIKNKKYLADTLPIAMIDYGTVTLSALLGCIPIFKDDSIWYNPCISDIKKYPHIVFQEDNKWWNILKAKIDAFKNVDNRDFILGAPALTPGMDCLAAMMGTEKLLIEMIDNECLIRKKLNEIQEAYFEIFDKIYDSISLRDKSSAFGYFSLWGNGKTAQAQCDISAMFSTNMFTNFVLPYLNEQCDKLDNVMYHLDGTQALRHLEALLSVEKLRAIEWTPQSSIESGGNPRWYELYKYILKGRKSIQIMDVKPNEVEPLIEAVGNNGLFINVIANNEDEAFMVSERLDRLR